MFKKICVSILAVGILASCKPSPREGADGYSFGTPQYVKQQITIQVVTYSNAKQLQAAAKARGVNNPDIVAFSVLRPPTFDVCTVHMIDPQVQYEPEFVGHEFLHCAYGQWHSSNDSRS